MNTLTLSKQTDSPAGALEAAAAIQLLRNQSLEEALPLVVEEVGIYTGASKVLLYLTDPEYRRPENDRGWKLSGAWAAEKADKTAGWEESRMLSSFYHALYSNRETESIDISSDSSNEVLAGFLDVLGVSSLLVVPFSADEATEGLLLVGTPFRSEEAILPDLEAAAEMIGSAVGQHRTIHKLTQRSHSFLRLNTLTHTALETSDLSEMLENLSMELSEMLSAEWAHIFLFPPEHSPELPTCYNIQTGGLFSVGTEEDMLPSSLCGLKHIRAFPGIEIATVNDHRWIDVPVGEGTLLALPLVDRRERHGLVVLQFPKARRFTIEEIALCDQAVIQIALGMTRTGLMLQLEDQVKKRTRNLAEAVEQMQRENEERAAAERQLRASEEQLQSVTDSAPMGIIMLAADGKIQFWNPAAERIFGYSSVQASGQPLASILSEESHTEFWNYVDHKYSLGNQVGSEFLALEGISASGQTLPLEISVGRWHQGEDSCYSILVRETREEREFRRWVERQGEFAFVGKLASSVAQDLNTILSAIILYAELLIGSSDLSEKGHNYVEMILQQSRRAASLSTELVNIDYSNTQVQKPLDPVVFLESIMGLLEHAFLEHRPISFIHGSSDYRLSVDERFLRQVILDLAFHLRDGMDDEEEIQIRLDRMHVSMDSKGAAALDIGDWIGIGISIRGEMDQESAAPDVEPDPSGSEPYYESPGISQLESLVQRHNGVLLHQPDSNGRPMFRIYFPALTVSEDIEDDQDCSLPKDNYRSFVILVVEDEEVSRKAVCEILEGQGYSTLEAENGKKALDILHGHDVDLIITDVIMPEMGGIALINRVHRDIGHKEVLIMSGYPLGEGPGELLNSEGVRWLKKPISAATLKRAAAEAMNRHNSSPMDD